jgi:hypothetical protein
MHDPRFQAFCSLIPPSALSPGRLRPKDGYVDLQRSVDRVRIADLQHHSISLNLTTPVRR